MGWILGLSQRVADGLDLSEGLIMDWWKPYEIERRRADKYPTAFPCIDKQRRVQFLITSTSNPPSRLHLGPIHLPLWLKPKTQPKPEELYQIDQKLASC